MYFISIKMDDNNEINLVFESEEDKSAYIKKEYQFCSKTRGDYFSCSANDIKKFREKYWASRKQFAAMNNFVATKDLTIWRKENEQQTNQTSA